MIRVVCLTLMLVSHGCGDESETAELSGSVSRVYGLSFDSTRALMTNDELAIQYIENGAVVVQVVLNRRQAGSIVPGSYDLGTLGTVVGDRPDGPLPDFKSGSLTLTRFSDDDGAAIAGSFAATVETLTSEYSVVGRFSTTLRLVP